MLELMVSEIACVYTCALVCMHGRCFWYEYNAFEFELMDWFSRCLTVMWSAPVVSAHVAELSKNKYGKFIIRKLLKYG